MANYYDHDKPFVIIDNNGAPLPSVNVCAGPYKTVTEARSAAINIFNSTSNIPDGLETKIWVDEQLIDYVWYNSTFNPKPSSSSADYSSLQLKFVYLVTEYTTTPNRPTDTLTPTSWSETISASAKGYVWMTVAKTSGTWENEHIWKDPMLIGTIGNLTSNDDSSAEDLVFIYQTTANASAPALATNKQTCNGWTSTVTTGKSGYIWMSYGKKTSDGVLLTWPDGTYWKTPVLLSKVDETETSSDFDDLVFIYQLTTDTKTPTLNLKVSYATGWVNQITPGKTGYIWMSYSRKDSDGQASTWPDGTYWKAPTYIGYAVAVDEEAEETTISYTTKYAYRKTENNTLDIATSKFLNRNEESYPPTNWEISITPLLDDVDGYVWETSAYLLANGNYMTLGDGYIWAEPRLVNIIGDPENTYKPTNLCQLDSLFGLVECSAEGVPYDDQEFETTVRIFSDGEELSGDFTIEVNGVTMKTTDLVVAKSNKLSAATCHKSGNTLTFAPTTDWTDSMTKTFEIFASYGDIECRTTYMFAKVPAGESIQGIEGSVIRYRGYLSNLSAGDILCYKVNEDGGTEGVTYIDYVKAAPSEFSGGYGDEETYYMYTGANSGKTTYTIKSNTKPNISDFEKAETFQFIATDVLLAENALIHNLQTGTLFFYDDSGKETTDHITGGITGQPKHLGGNYLIFGGELNGKTSTWENPNFRVDENGLLHIRYSETADDDSINYKGYVWSQTQDKLTSQFYEVSGDVDDLTTKYSTLTQTIDDITARVESAETTVDTFSNQYAEWKLTVDGYTVTAGKYVEEYGKILELYSNFEVTAASINASVKEIINKEETLETTLNQTATTITAQIKENNEVLTSLGLSSSGINMVGKSVIYKPTSSSEAVLVLNSAGLTIKGDVSATTLTAGDTTSSSYLYYSAATGLKVKGNIEATSLTFSGSSADALDAWATSKGFASESSFSSEFATLQSNINSANSKIDQSISNLKTAVDKQINSLTSSISSVSSTATSAYELAKAGTSTKADDGTTYTIDLVIASTKTATNTLSDFFAMFGTNSLYTYIDADKIVTETVMARAIQGGTGTFVSVLANEGSFVNVIAESVLAKGIYAEDLTISETDGTKMFYIETDSSGNKKVTIPNLVVSTLQDFTGTDILAKINSLGSGAPSINNDYFSISGGKIGGWYIDDNSIYNQYDSGACIYLGGVNASYLGIHMYQHAGSVMLISDYNPTNGFRMYLSDPGIDNPSVQFSPDGSGVLSFGNISWDGSGNGYIGSSSNKSFSWTSTGAINIGGYTVEGNSLYAYYDTTNKYGMSLYSGKGMFPCSLYMSQARGYLKLQTSSNGQEIDLRLGSNPVFTAGYASGSVSLYFGCEELYSTGGMNVSSTMYANTFKFKVGKYNLLEATCAIDVENATITLAASKNTIYITYNGQKYKAIDATGSSIGQYFNDGKASADMQIINGLLVVPVS